MVVVYLFVCLYLFIESSRARTNERSPICTLKMSVNSVNTVKCTSCNVVISEVLAFIRNRHDVVDNESLIQICSSAFSEEDIDEAKKLLFVSTKTSQKLVSRRKNKKQKDLEDMITVFKTMDPEQIPVFVAYDLHKLPPVCFDHVDVTKLLKDLLVLRSEVNAIKSDYVTKDQLENMKLKTSNSTPGPLPSLNVNIERGGYIENNNSEALSVSHKTVCAPSPSQRSPSCMSHDHSSAVPLTSTASDRDIIRVLPAPQRTTSITIAEKQLTTAEIVSNGKWKENKRDDGWTLVQKSKPRNRFTGLTGKAVSNVPIKFRAADMKIPLFISYVNKETTEEDICDYIQSKVNEVVTLERINMKADRQYNAFKLFVPKNKINTFLDDNLWPEGIAFRRFIHFKNRIDKRILNVNSSQNNG